MSYEVRVYYPDGRLKKIIPSRTEREILSTPISKEPSLRVTTMAQRVKFGNLEGKKNKNKNLGGNENDKTQGSTTESGGTGEA